jgi:hypothetical protein
MGEMADNIFEIRFPDVEVSESRNRIESFGSVRNEQREKDRAGISFLAQTLPDRDHPSHQNSRPTKKKI